MKRHFKVVLFFTVLSLIAIFSRSISNEIVKNYNNCKSAIEISSSTQICYQLASR